MCLCVGAGGTVFAFGVGEHDPLNAVFSPFLLMTPHCASATTTLEGTVLHTHPERAVALRANVFFVGANLRRTAAALASIAHPHRAFLERAISERFGAAS